MKIIKEISKYDRRSNAIKKNPIKLEVAINFTFNRKWNIKVI